MTGGEGSGWAPGWRRTHSEGGWVMCAVWQRPQVKGNQENTREKRAEIPSKG